MMVSEIFDVVIVGARCAGSPLAALLARQGLKVAVVERATFPRDTLSTHVVEADALAFLDRLGVTDRLRATGAPYVSQLNIRVDDYHFSTHWPQRAGDVGGSASIRRIVLDPILVQAAEESGAQVRMATQVTGLVREGDRVAGVRVNADGRDGELRARLVVGADGRNSTVADLVEARKYNITPNERFAYWTFFEGADTGSEPTHVLHRWAERFVVATPCDSGLYHVIVVPDLCELSQFRAHLETSFMEYARSCEPIANAIADATQAGRFLGMLHWNGYFREPSGPGWVLVGDAGHFKDPSPGRGIGDAFLQAEMLAPAIVGALNGGGDDELARWGRWRDREFGEHHWFASDLGAAGLMPAVFPDMVMEMYGKGQFGEFLDLYAHRTKPSEILSPARLLGSAGRLLRHRGNRRALLKEVGTLVGQNARRQRLNRRPVYATPAEMSHSAGATEVETSA